MVFQHLKDILKLISEIIYYSSVGTNQLGIGTRGIDNTIVRTHSVNDLAT